MAVAARRDDPLACPLARVTLGVHRMCVPTAVFTLTWLQVHVTPFPTAFAASAGVHDKTDPYLRMVKQ